MADDTIRTCILSHGRSGTLYTAKILQSIGLDFGHEKDGKDGAIGGIFFKGDRDLSSYGQIFHQVRHPLNVISSSTTCKPSSFKKVFEKTGLGEMNEKDPLRRAMLSWVFYTSWAEKHSVWRYKIEDIKTIWPELLFRMGLDKIDLPDVPANTNARKHKNYTWDELTKKDPMLTIGIKESARRFGYTEV
jgi:hypothetical protein